MIKFFSKHQTQSLYLTIAAASLWMRTGFPIRAIASGAADDELFLRLARSIVAGDWLGSYNNLTLAKGMFYPLFIALVSVTAIPLKLLEQCLYLLASALVSALVARCTKHRWLGLLLFALLAFSPVLWNQHLSRVIREGIYGSLALLVVTLTVMVAFPSPRPVWRGALLGGVLGLVAGAFWLTREEGPWLLPSIAAVLVVGFISHWRERRHNQPMYRGLTWTLGVPLVAAGLCFGASNILVARLNASYYGVSETTEFKSASFQRGYGALSRVQPVTWQRYVVFPTEIRQRVYAVSRAAQELAPAFEGSNGAGWRQTGCDQLSIPAASCSEILSGWFMWALRDAVALAGYYRSAPEAAAFYDRLAAEIDDACMAKKLECLPPRATLAPPFRWHYVLDALVPAQRLLELLFTLREGVVASVPSEGSRTGIAIFADVAGPVVPPSTLTRRVQGWVAARAAIPDLYIRAQSGQVATSHLTRLPGEDVRGTYPDMFPVRFQLESDCPPGSCILMLNASNSGSFSVPWDSVAPGMVADTQEFRLFIEYLTVQDVTATSGKRRALQQFVGRLLGRVYAALLPMAAVLGVAGSLLALLLLRPLPWVLLGLMAGSITAIAARIALLAYLDATSIPSANLLYVSPAAPFVLVLAVVGIWLGVAALNGIRGSAYIKAI